MYFSTCWDGAFQSVLRSFRSSFMAGSRELSRAVRGSALLVAATTVSARAGSASATRAIPVQHVSCLLFL